MTPVRPKPLFFWALALVAANVACDSKPKATADSSVASAAPIVSGTPTNEGPRMMPAPPGTDAVGPIVQRIRADEAKRGREVLVYVGATWCEPCQRFHHAVAEGKLTADFPNVTFLEFDADRDGLRLKDSGYTSKYIPLFVRPADDGLASDAKMEGSIKGDGAVAEITPRLRALLAAR